MVEHCDIRSLYHMWSLVVLHNLCPSMRNGSWWLDHPIMFLRRACLLYYDCSQQVWCEYSFENSTDLYRLMVPLLPLCRGNFGDAKRWQPDLFCVWMLVLGRSRAKHRDFFLKHTSDICKGLNNAWICWRMEFCDVALKRLCLSCLSRIIFLLLLSIGLLSVPD